MLGILIYFAWKQKKKNSACLKKSTIRPIFEAFKDGAY